ncbi:MAG: hypothetical protein CL413_05505 [Acidimicrobiaceae bacterium]|nr:hypothetical protein [Acidimicrobiaceae bacterium]
MPSTMRPPSRRKASSMSSSGASAGRRKRVRGDTPVRSHSRGHEASIPPSVVVIDAAPYDEVPMSERTTRTQIEANVDDLDPRIWPRVIEQLLAVGADDAWITPIVMKKGRPAFTLGVLCGDGVVDEVRRVIFTETSSIGLRETIVTKHALPRSFTSVEIEGHPIAIKRADFDGTEVNRSVEWDDVVRVADALGMSANDVLVAALQAGREQQA